MRLNNQRTPEGRERTELGDEIASEKAGAAKNSRNVPSYCTAPRRTIRDNRWLVRQRVHSPLWQAMMTGQRQVFPAEKWRDIPFLKMSQRAVAVQMMQKKGAWGGVLSPSCLMSPSCGRFRVRGMVLSDVSVTLTLLETFSYPVTAYVVPFQTLLRNPHGSRNH